MKGFVVPSAVAAMRELIRPARESSGPTARGSRYWEVRMFKAQDSDGRFILGEVRPTGCSLKLMCV